MPDAAARRLLVSAWIGSTNLGDELVAAALTAKLRARGLEPTLLSVDPAATRAAHRVAAGTLVEVLREGRGRGDAVLLGGGGLVQDVTSPFNLPFHLGRTALVAGRRPVAGIGLGAGPLAGRLGRRLAATSLRGAVAVSVRDRASAEVLDGLGVRSTLAADLALSLPLPAVAARPRIGVSLRPWSGVRSAVPVGLRRARPGPGVPPWFVDGTAAALDQAAARTGLGVHFVALQADRDDAVHRAVAARMQAPATFATPDVSGVVAEVAACEVVVAMRYHAAVAAVLGGRPAVLLGYDPKVPALAGDVPDGLTGLTWDPAGLASLAGALASVRGRGDAVLAGRDRLRERERRNDLVLDDLLDALDRGR